MARIRTIKPDFWKHEDLSELAADTHMLAAALLNYSDDEGYFKANPKLIISDCCPLRELSVSVQDSLKSLSKIGYIRLGKTEDGKFYGQVIEFLTHQRINRPTSSKISGLDIVWDTSTTPHGNLTEASPPERKGKEGKGRERNNITTTESETTRETDDKPHGGGVVSPEIPDIPTSLDRQPRLEDQTEAKPLPASPGSKVATAYMAAVNEIYGTEHLLAHAGSGAPQIAARWLEAGATVALCRDVFLTILQTQKSKGEQPPATLKYFDQPIARAIKDGKAPMPKIGSKDEQPGIHPDADRNKWAARLRGYAESGLWLDSWGNPPGNPQCEAPSDLLAAYNKEKSETPETAASYCGEAREV